MRIETDPNRALGTGVTKAILRRRIKTSPRSGLNLNFVYPGGRQNKQPPAGG
jgi:hypothetical protein